MTPLLPTPKRRRAINPAVATDGVDAVADAVTNLKPRLRTHPLPPKRPTLRRRPNLQHPNPKNPC